MASTRVGIWLTVLSGAAFAASGPLAKTVLAGGWSPGAVLAIRLTGAAMVTLALAAVTDFPALLDSRRHLRALAAFGVVAMTGVQATFFLSLEHLQVGVALMIQFLAPVALSLGLLILISTAVAYLSGVAGAARIGSTLMSLILLSEVLFAVVLSWVLLGEAVAPIQLAGGAVVVGGIVLARRGGAQRTPLADAPAPGPART
ncbi:EamA family transporter [Nocardia takedensis]|uniref:EamA family transporter n=1 Tax=Nocardia takedensis TaxID=259390 RepID=UPI0002D33725|nr:EamA family transporter [Nocardia takedensis]